MERMWINQPSRMQSFHHLHGVNVLARHDTYKAHRVYFLSGDVVSQQIPITALSFGWRKP